MKYQIVNVELDIVVAEYTANAPMLPNQFDAAYSGANYITRAVDTEVVLNSGVNSITYTKLEFLRRFTQDERITIRTVAKTNAQIEDFMDLLNLAENVVSTDADVIAALTLLEQAGILNAGRATEIMGNQ
jgi:transcriptional antiterminator